MASILNGKRIILTGASRGVGFATASALIESGASILGIARDADRLTVAADELMTLGPGTFDGLVADLEDAATPSRIAERAGELWGAVDVVVNNAGVMLHHEGGICSEPEDIVQRSMDINVFAPLRVGTALLPLLREGVEPRIVNVGSGAGTIEALAEPGIASYRLSKWALNGLTMLQAHELAGEISVIAFDPGWVKTDLGGPQAPGTPEEAADGLIRTLELPWDVSGGFFKDGQPIPW